MLNYLLLCVYITASRDTGWGISIRIRQQLSFGLEAIWTTSSNNEKGPQCHQCSGERENYERSHKRGFFYFVRKVRKTGLLGLLLKFKLQSDFWKKNCNYLETLPDFVTLRLFLTFWHCRKKNVWEGTFCSVVAMAVDFIMCKSSLVRVEETAKWSLLMIKWIQLEANVQKSFLESTTFLSPLQKEDKDSTDLGYMTSEKAYRIVLAGDAAVGKSSFLLRLCKNEFKMNSSATLGELDTN